MADAERLLIALCRLTEVALAIALLCVLVAAFGGCQRPEPPAAEPPREPASPPAERELRVKIQVVWPGWTDEAISLRVAAAEQMFAERGFRLRVTDVARENDAGFETVDDWDLEPLLLRTRDRPEPTAYFVKAISVTLGAVGPPAQYGGLGYRSPARLLLCAWISCLTVLGHELGHWLCLDHGGELGNAMNVRTCGMPASFTWEQRLDMIACPKTNLGARVTAGGPFVCGGRV